MAPFRKTTRRGRLSIGTQRTTPPRNAQTQRDRARSLHARKLYSTFGRSGISNRIAQAMLCASLFGQSSFSCSFHFIRLALRPYFLDESGDTIPALGNAERPRKDLRQERGGK